MSFKDKFDNKKKLIIGIVVLIVGLLFVWFTTGFSSSGFVPESDAVYSFWMSIILLIPAILLLIPVRNEQLTKIIKTILYIVLVIFILYCLLCIPATHGPFMVYYIIALLLIVIDLVCNYIR